jgi:excinuclease ABC subunit A
LEIVIRGAKEHNLKNIDLRIPRDKLVVITGLSGSGKSSLAFDTIYAEGQRRYVESLSSYARQFLEQMEKPEVESIEGLSPAISIEQKTVSKNPRSTVATTTEIYDYLRLLFSRAGTPHCWQCGKEITSQTVQQMVDRILELPERTKLQILAPVVRGRKGEYRQVFEDMRKDGYIRVRVDGVIRELEEKIDLDKNKKHDIEVVIDRLVIKEGIAQRTADSLETALKLADGIVLINVLDGQDLLFSEKLACIDCGISYPEMAPRMFSFNSPYGACPECDGLGIKRELDPDLLVPDKTKPLREGAIAPWEGSSSTYLYQMLESLASHYRFSLDTPFQDLSEKVQQVILYGSGKEEISFTYQNDHRKHTYRAKYEGIIGEMTRRYKETSSDYSRESIEAYMSTRLCMACQGNRLKKESLSIKINVMAISDFTRLSIREAWETLPKLFFTSQRKKIAEPILKEIRNRLGFLRKVGLNYLTLDRPSATLSGGEGQRIRLATQIGSGLVGVLYILDEPSIGLHQRDNRRLLETLKDLKDLGNTVLVVEHDEETIWAADYVVDLGPGAGKQGGYVVACGTPQEIAANPDSLTGRYLKGELSIPIPEQRRPIGEGKRQKAKGKKQKIEEESRGGKWLVLVGAREHNLKNLTVEIPLGVITCITGVSGSGKSTLITEILYKELAHKFYRAKERGGEHDKILGYEYIDKVIDIDQSPIGRTPRSNPATYTGTFGLIRDLFAQVPDARMRGYKPGRFSFNVKGGRCEACQGDGVIKIEMHFLPDVYVTCEVCKGQRYNRETLEIKYKGKTIADVLDMTVAEVLTFLENIPSIQKKLQTLYDVGLDYIHLGQSATTLSGGEAQRIKLAKELSRQDTGNTLYILDEPTTGLHFEDIKKLLGVLNRLADAGNTVIIIEHNLDVIKSADYIIDLGPEGGDEGGYLIAAGTPEEVAKVEKSYTGQFLKKILVPAEGRR